MIFMFSGMRVGIVFRRCGAEFCFVSPVGARASAVLPSAQMAADQYCSAAVLQSETGRELRLMVM